MRCEEYRKAIAADPAAPLDDTHAAQCAACSAFRNEMLAFDERIARALEIDVPELRLPELPAADCGATGRVVSLAERRPGGRRAAAWKRRTVLSGLAAGFAAVAALALLNVTTQGPRTLAEEIIAHMDHEQASRRITRVAVSERALEQVVGPKVSQMDGGMGLISYAASCVIRGRTVPHLVMQGESGPITLILLPDESIGRPVRLDGSHVYGLIVPVGAGSVAVIGEREEQLPEVTDTGQRLAASVRWRT